MYADHDPLFLLIFTDVGLICLQYLEIEVKNPRTHIENEKALYTDYEIEVKVSLSHSILYCICCWKGQVYGSAQPFYLRSEDSSFSCTGI